MDWAWHFPAFVDPDPTKTTLSGARTLVKDVEVVDIGCGFGGLLAGLAPLMPDTLIVGKWIQTETLVLKGKKGPDENLPSFIGMEIRVQVLEYLRNRILVLRAQQQKIGEPFTSTPSPTTSPTLASEELPLPEMLSSTPTPIPGGYQNISALRANTMKFLPNFFSRHQLSKIFICFPDPHFKVRKHKARIVSSGLNAEYAYVLRPGGLLYTITDVEEYHHWILGHFVKKRKLVEGESTPADAKQEEQDADDDEQDNDAGVKELWERLSDEELAMDVYIPVMKEETEEGKKVTRNNGNKFVAVFRRRPDPDWLD